MRGPTGLPGGFKREAEKMLERMRAADFDSVFSIMEESFPADEHRPYGEQKELLSDPRYGLYVLTEPENGKTQAFIALWKFADFAYMEHFAVAAQYRGQGLGSRVLREIKQMLECPICLEVEPPKTDQAERRIAFYRRNGFFLNDCLYIQPPISKGRNPLPLMLMTSEGRITGEQFEKIKTALYQNVYKVENYQ